MRIVARWMIFGALVALAVPAMAEPVWAVEDTSTRRWMDNADAQAGDVSTGDRLDVVYREGDWIRVRLSAVGAGFGWLPADKVTETAPAGQGAGGFDLGLPGALDLPGKRPTDLNLPGAFPGGSSTLPLGPTTLPPVNIDLE